MKTLLGTAGLVLLAIAAQFAQAQALYQSGTHYEIVSEERAPAGGEVTEFFWYGCPGCFALEPMLKRWHAQRGEEVTLRREPAVWNDTTLRHARIFFAEEALGILEAHHQEVFDEIHLRRNALLDEEDVLAFFSARGVDGEAFRGALSSFGVDAGLRKAQARQRALRIAGVPSLLVNGKYLVKTNAAVRTPEDVLRVVDYLLGLDE